MKRLITAISTVTLTLFVLAVGLTFASDGPDKDMSVSTAALVTNSANASEGGGSSNFGTGFEVSEGYATGYCAGQNGWTAFSSSVVEGHIDTAAPASGAQHMRNSKDPAVATATNVGCFSPLIAYNLGNGISVLSADVNIGASGGADYFLVPQTPTELSVNFYVRYNWLGNIYVTDDIGGGFAFIDTGVAYPTGVYHNIVVVLDNTADTTDYYVNGALLYSNVGGVVAGTTIEQTLFFSDNYQAGESGDIDNLYFANNVMPAITVTATVGTGTDCSAITATSTTVTAGASVTHCYTVNNTGNVMLQGHTADDSILGSLLAGVDVDLVPGASVTISATETATASGTYVLDWTADVGAPTVSASDTATATVTVNAPTDVALISLDGETTGISPLLLLAPLAVLLVGAVYLRRRSLLGSA